jgi:hypothetical protein
VLVSGAYPNQPDPGSACQALTIGELQETETARPGSSTTGRLNGTNAIANTAMPSAIAVASVQLRTPRS